MLSASCPVEYQIQELQNKRFHCPRDHSVCKHGTRDRHAAGQPIESSQQRPIEEMKAVKTALLSVLPKHVNRSGEILFRKSFVFSTQDKGNATKGFV